MNILNDIQIDKAPTPSTRPKRKKKSFADKEVQCQLPTNSHSPDDPFCECKDVHIISSNDQYNTNFHIKGNNHDVCIGQVFHGGEMNLGGLEKGALPSNLSEQNLSDNVQFNSSNGKSHEVNGHYKTTLQFKKPQNNSFTFEIQTQNYSPTFQLDASATKEILLSNPEIIQALIHKNTFTLCDTTENEDKENTCPNIKPNVFSRGKDIHECLYENRINADKTQRRVSCSKSFRFSNETVIKIAPKVSIVFDTVLVA